MDTSLDLTKYILITLELVAINCFAFFLAWYNSAAHCAYQAYPILQSSFFHCSDTLYPQLSSNVVINFMICLSVSCICPMEVHIFCHNSGIWLKKTGSKHNQSCDVWSKDLLKPKFFWHVMICHWVSGSYSFEGILLTAWPWRWRNRNPSNYRELLTQQHSVISQKNGTFSTSVMEPEVLQGVM